MRMFLTVCVVALLSACVSQPTAGPQPEYYGTLEPFASEAVYFVLTDRFVDGDPGNNHVDQGGSELGTFDRPIEHPEGGTGNIGYLGGDFKGILSNGAYIAEMGFTAVWLTPIVDNPDEAFTGGFTLEENPFADRGKTGYHGYWGVNFFEVDEHLPSPGLSFADYTRRMRDEFGLKTVLDIVCNHGSPSFTMPHDRPKFGEIYGRDGELLADHQNLLPEDLDDGNPLHDFFHREPDITQLSNMNEDNPAVLDYFVQAHLHWIGQGVDALRIDTIKHMPHSFWRRFSDRVRAAHPGLFMFGESFEYDARVIAEHTYTENGGINVLDFPGKALMNEVFAGGADYARLVDYLHLTDGVYQNPYEQMTFYDNHDMPRMAATDAGFINANNWLFTSRGIPVVYYGSESAFRAGLAEHRGNRDYFGQDNVDAAKGHPIRRSLSAIANVRRNSPALQRGVQANLAFSESTAVFYRVYQHDGIAQTALVMLNKAGAPAEITVDRWLSAGIWRDAMTGEATEIAPGSPAMTTTVDANGVRVFLFDGLNNDAGLAVELDRLHAGARSRAQAARVSSGWDLLSSAGIADD